jgi:hypothetical protein
MTTNKTITLDTPIKRGDDTFTSIALRKPAAGELRGCNLTDLLQMDVAALQRVLPRITTPTLTEQEVGRMDPADLLQLGTEVSGFLLPKATKPEAFQPE